MAVNGSRIVTISPCAPAAPPPPPAAFPCAHLPSPRVSSIRFCRTHLSSAGGGGRDCRNRARSSRRRAAIVAGAAANRVGGQGGGESFDNSSNADERLSADRENADRGGAGGGNAERLEDLEAVDRLAQELAAAAGAAGAESGTLDRRSAAHEAEKAEAEAEEQQGRRGARGEGDDAAASWIGSSVAFAEEDEQGRKYLELLVTSVHRVDHGTATNLHSPCLSLPPSSSVPPPPLPRPSSVPPLPVSSCNRHGGGGAMFTGQQGSPVDACWEFPLFLNALIAALSLPLPSPSPYLPSVPLCNRHGGGGMVVGVLCSPANRGPPVDACREFPLFLNDLIAAPCHDAMQRGGLPNALEGLERLSDMDLQRTLVHAINEDIGAVSFVLLDEKTGEFSRVDSSFPQAMALALRYRQPLRVERWCILASNRDFIERMLLNPIAREAENDASLLADLAQRMRELEMRPQELKTQLNSAINAEEVRRNKNCLLHSLPSPPIPSHSSFPTTTRPLFPPQQEEAAGLNASLVAIHPIWSILPPTPPDFSSQYERAAQLKAALVAEERVADARLFFECVSRSTLPPTPPFPTSPPQYERAAQLKAALVAEERVADARLFSLLEEVKRLYLDRLSVFFKL
ncbi:unnamed protein product [Closterium sp. Naga37s-1]|nr:unnamed protein product [Closterium sp. Naga37s-1]